MATSYSQKTISIINGYYIKKITAITTKNKLELHERSCENKDFCSIIMPSEDTKIL